jgi:hypothetical protein
MPEHDDEGGAPSHLSRKSTLVKSRVGCVRKSTYDLPESNDHVYGIKNDKKEEGVGPLISSWHTSNPSSGKESSKLIVFSNILAIKNGCVTARAMRKYAFEHPNIRRKEALQASSARVDTRFEGPFGKKTETSGDAMDMIIQEKYTTFGPEDVDYPDISCIKKTGSFPKPRATVASESVRRAREKKEAKPKKNFCMKRFQNIKGTFHLPNNKNVVPPTIPGESKHDEVLVHHHHDLDAGMYHGRDHHTHYAHEVPHNLSTRLGGGIQSSYQEYED